MSTTGPSDTTIRRLFAVSMNRCAFSGCGTPIIDPTSNTILAEVCHIHARNQRGPRYNPNQTDEERHGFDNLILMCGVHHKLIDAPENLNRFTSEALIVLKARHEQAARAAAQNIPRLTDEQLTALQFGANYQPESTHNDFRHAVFRVGGEGGQWGGGGGGGGVLTIVGTTRIPASVSLIGQDGQAPGGGGGGGGAVRYVGRPIDTDDLVGGVCLNSLLLVSAASFSAGLLNILDAGWTYIGVPLTPAPLRIMLAMTIEFGEVEPTTLLRLSVQVVTPSGAVALERSLDIEVPDCPDLVKRASHVQPLNLEVTEHGLWTIIVRSSTHELGRHGFECRKV